MKKIIMILVICIVTASSFFLYKELTKPKKLYIYNENSQLFIADKNGNNETIISSNYNGSNISKEKVSIVGDKIIYIDSYTYNNTYNLKYVLTKDIFKSDYAETYDLALNITSHTVIDGHILYLNNGTLYQYDNNSKMLATNVRDFIFDNNVAYYLMENGTLYKIDKRLSITEEATDVLDILEIFKNDIIYTKRTNISKLSLYVKNLYMGNKLITENLYKYIGLKDGNINYQELSTSILDEIKEDTVIGFKNEITGINNALPTNDKIIYMIGSNGCGHCQALLPIMEELAKELGFIFNYVDYPTISLQEQNKVNSIYDIKSFPTLLVTDHSSKLLSNRIGYASKEIIREFILSNVEGNKVIDVDFGDYIVIKTFK